MSRTKLQINQLRLRVGGLTREQGRRLGEIVAKQLAETVLVKAPRRKISALTIRAGSTASSSVEGLAHEIACKVRDSLS